MPLTVRVASISYWNVWNLPWSVWVGYASMVDAWLAELERNASKSERGVRG